MKKIEFLAELRGRLAGLDEHEIEESLAYWRELIDDRIEEGLDEDAAVSALGTPREAAEAILCEKPITRLVKARMKPRRRLAVWETVLLWVGSPIWIALLISALAVVFSVYVSIWAVVASLWAAELSFAVTALASPVFAILGGSVGATLFYAGEGILLVGLSILMWFGCIVTTKYAVRLGAWILVRIKRALIRKEAIR